METKEVLNENNLNQILDSTSINQPHKFQTSKIFSFGFLGFGILLGLSFLLLFSILNDQRFGEIFLKNLATDTYQPIRISLIIICATSLIFNSLQLITVYKIDLQNSQIINQWQFIYLSILGVNFPQLIFVTFFSNRSAKKTLKIRRWNWRRFGFWKWKTWDITILGIFTGLTIFFTFLEGITVIPFLPIGGTLTLKYLMVLVISFFHSFLGGFIVGGVSAFMAILIVPSTLIISPLSFLFDYFLPMVSPAIAGLMVFMIPQKKNFFEIVNYFLITFTTFVLICLWQILAGYFVWVQLYGPLWGNNGLVYAIVANLAVSFGLNYPVTQLLVPPVFRIMARFNWESQKQLNFQ